MNALKASANKIQEVITISIFFLLEVCEIYFETSYHLFFSLTLSVFDKEEN